MGASCKELERRLNYCIYINIYIYKIYKELRLNKRRGFILVYFYGIPSLAPPRSVATKVDSERDELNEAAPYDEFVELKDP